MLLLTTSLSLSLTLFIAPTITITYHDVATKNCQGKVTFTESYTAGTCYTTDLDEVYSYVTGGLSAPSTSSVPVPSSPPNTAPSVSVPSASPSTAPAGATAAVSTTSTSSKSCFAGSETLIMESGGVRAMSSIRLGDRVLAANARGENRFSEVVFIPHGANKDEATFVYITTETGRDLKLTKNHVLPAGVCGTTLSLRYASKVFVGDCIMTVSGMEEVSAVETIQGQGLYTIVTKEEYVVVNGIIASPFGLNHMMANLYYNIHRFVYMTSPFLLTWPYLHATNEVCNYQEDLLQ
jgi:Hint module